MHRAARGLSEAGHSVVCASLVPPAHACGTLCWRKKHSPKAVLMCARKPSAAVSLAVQEGMLAIRLLVEDAWSAVGTWKIR